MALTKGPGKPGIGKDILKKKIAGIPVPILAAGAGVIGVIAYRRYAAGGGAASSSAADNTPADYSGGTAGGGGAGDYSGGTGDQGSYYDQGYGGAGAAVGGGDVIGAGGAFVPQAGAAGSAPYAPPPFLTKRVIIRRPPARKHRAHKRPLIVNKVIVNPKGRKPAMGARPKKRYPKIQSTKKAGVGLGHG